MGTALRRSRNASMNSRPLAALANNNDDLQVITSLNFRSRSLNEGIA